MVKKNACVFISGNGTNLKNLIKSSREYNFPINISLIVCNNFGAPGILYAKKNSIPYLVIDTRKRNFEQKILRQTKKSKISVICLAGYMKIISKNFLRSYGKLIINVHPSLLPKYKGLNTFAKVLRNKDIKTGSTIHKVDEKLDNGKIVSQKSFFINPNDNEEDLKRKTQKIEYKIYPEAIINLFRYT